MRTLASEITGYLKDRSNTDGQWTRLYEAVVDSSTIRYYTDYQKQLSFDSGSGSNSYIPFPIKLAQLPETVDVENNTFEVSIANIDKSIIIELENRNIIGNRFTIFDVFIKNLNDEVVLAFRTDYIFVSAKTTPDGAYVVFEIGDENLLSVELPRHRWTDFRCDFSYKDIGTCHYGRDEFLGNTEGNLLAAGDGVKWQGWNFKNSSNATLADINITTADHLVIRVAKTVDIPWVIPSFPLSGPWLYRIFDRDNADMDLDLDIEMKVDTSTITEAEEGVGIIISGDSDSSNDVVAMFKTFESIAGALRNQATNIVDGSIVTNVGSGGATDSFIRILKQGSSFKFYSKANETDSWTQFYSTVTNSNLFNVSLRAGVYVKTEDSLRSTDFDATVDFWRLVSGGLKTCKRFRSDCALHDNLRRFGGAPGILHGPLQL